MIKQGRRPCRPSSVSAVTTVARLSTDTATARKIGDALAESFDAGRVATSMFEEPDGRWSFAAHFQQAPEAEAVRRLIIAAAGKAAANALVLETLAPTDWVRTGLDALKPVEVGRFVVHGAHDRARVGRNRIGIQIEAALAFGTGHHASTRGCLLALNDILKGRGARRRTRTASPRSRMPARRILDIGTGTGVLAIAAARLLRQPVLASDVDPRAVAVAQENVRINRVAAYVKVIRAAGVLGRRFRQCGPFDLILANILLEPLKQLATPLAHLTRRNGRIVLSGLLAAQATAAIACYRARGLVLVRRITLGGWTTLVLERPALACTPNRKFMSRTIPGMRNVRARAAAPK